MNPPRLFQPELSEEELQFDIFEKISKICSDLFGFWKLYMQFFCLFFFFFGKSFDTQAQFSIFDSDDFDIDTVSCLQDIGRCFDPFFADLGYMDKSGEAIVKADKR